MTAVRRPRWLPSRDRQDPDAHLVLSPHGNGACGVAVLGSESSPVFTGHPCCAVCAGLPEAAEQGGTMPEAPRVAP